MQKKNKKKGFTLIELLAVLVVLAILAFIAIPVITNVINKARKQSYQRSIESYVRATELAMQEWQIENPNGTAPTTLSSYTIEVKGDQVSCNDEIEKSSNGGIKLTGCYTEKSKKKYPNLRYTYDGGKIFEEDTEPIATYEEYNVGDTFTFGGAGYHVISESGIDQDYVVALKDEPLTTDEVTSLGYTPSYTWTGTKHWAGMYYDNTDPKSTDYDTSDVKSLVDAWANQYASKLSEVNGYTARLIKIEELESLGYVYNGSYYPLNSNIDSWLYNSEYWYWTMSQYQDSASNVWYVNGSGNLNNSLVGNNSGGVRPVINVYKSEISEN